MSRFRRFLHLEKDRAAPSTPSARSRTPVAPEAGPDEGAAREATRKTSTQGRFGAPASAGEESTASGPTPSAPRSGAALERFASSPATALRTDREAAAPSAGSRCSVCEREFGRFDVACPTCGAPLDSPQQLAFSQRLSEERAAHLAQEQAELQRLRALRSGADEVQRRALAEAQQALGRELAERVRGSLLADPWHSPSPFPGQRWLALIQPAANRDLVRLVSLMIGFAWVLAGLFASRGVWRLIWLSLGGLSLWAFFPRWWRRPPPTNGPPDRGGL
ncbi:MAG: hypothetical protein M3Y59_21005 [Myxococcota bacterium]|nr:hypothetical protein [Myxococcota bacterium]